MTETRLIRIVAPLEEPFTEDDIRGVVGDEFPLKVEDKTFANGRCLGAEIADDGRSVLLTIEADQWPEGLTAFFEPDFATVTFSEQ